MDTFSQVAIGVLLVLTIVFGKAFWRKSE